jgi:hypothetical protein
MLADYLASKINYIWCPINMRRTYVSSVDKSGNDIRLNVAVVATKPHRNLCAG